MKQKRNTISAEDLKQLSDTFDALKPKPKTKYTAFEVVFALNDKILSAFSIGFDKHDICAMLKPYDVSITPGTLTSYLNTVAEKPASKKKTIKKQAAAPVANILSEKASLVSAPASLNPPQDISTRKNDDFIDKEIDRMLEIKADPKTNESPNNGEG